MHLEKQLGSFFFSFLHKICGEILREKRSTFKGGNSVIHDFIFLLKKGLLKKEQKWLHLGADSFLLE